MFYNMSCFTADNKMGLVQVYKKKKIMDDTSKVDCVH